MKKILFLIGLFFTLPLMGQVVNPPSGGGGGTSNPNTCTVNTALDKCLGVSPYLAVAGDWSVAVNQALIDLGSTGGTIHGCGTYPINGSPIDPSGSNALLRVPVITSGTISVITFEGCQPTNPSIANPSGMFFTTTNNTAGVNFLGGQATGPAFTDVKLVLHHTNFISSAAVPQINLVNANWMLALEMNDVILAGQGCTNPVSGTGGTALTTPSLSNNYQVTIDKVVVGCAAHAVVAQEHTAIQTLWIGSAHDGVKFDAGGGGGNGITAQYIWCQNCVNYALGPSAGGHPTTIAVEDFDMESDGGTGFNIADSTSQLTGYLNYVKRSPNSALTVNGAPNIALYDLTTSNYNIIQTNNLYLNGFAQLQLFSNSVSPAAGVVHDITNNVYPFIIRDNATGQKKGTEIPSDACYGYGSTSGGGAGIDTGACRDGAAGFDFGNGTPGDKSGTINLAAINLGGAAIKPTLSGTTAAIGGSLLAPGACVAGTVTVTGATSAMTATASPSADPDSTLSTGIAIYSFVSSSNTVTVRICAIVSVTPASVTYNVRVIQ